MRGKAASTPVTRPLTPSQGTSALVTVKAKSQGALMSATAKRVKALCSEHHTETVLVVYGHGNAASVFCETDEPPARSSVPTEDLS